MCTRIKTDLHIHILVKAAKIAAVKVGKALTSRQDLSKMDGKSHAGVSVMLLQLSAAELIASELSLT